MKFYTVLLVITVCISMKATENKEKSETYKKTELSKHLVFL